MNKSSNSIPMSTQLLEEYTSEEGDIRFTKVKLWLMHTGLNLNGSVFNKDVVEKAIPTLANTPIMASVSYNFDGEKDFEGHETDIEITEDGEIKLINSTVPFGVIPETNNAKFETRLGDDMVEREYLTCEGILWNKWDDAVEILQSKGGVTGQSMEISPNYTGYFDGENMIFETFSFYGACLLGDDVTPAMKNSTVEIKYAAKTDELIKEKLQVFNNIVYANKGGKEVPKKDTAVFEDQKAKEKAQEEPTSKTEVVEEPETKAKAKVTSAKEEKVLETKKQEKQEKPSEEPIIDAPPSVEDQVVVQTEEVGDVIDTHKEVKDDIDNLPEAADMITISGVEYSAEDIAEKLTELASVKSQLAEYQSKFEALQKEVHAEKVEQLFSTHKDSLSIESIEKLKAQADGITLPELETLIYAEIGRQNYSAKPKAETNATNFSQVAIPVNKTSNNSLEDIVASWK
ncbi:hypothetical protein FH133_00190 [Staphylococcus hominis]|uniref:hypothetical protein n=1 Tax=Staphylococcus hominis TaxID=1290 RepID=UPI001F579CA3|nr:hypothetical protein [Staphylococcus hominis]MCI2919722.1 hypothetical protein [Staphylococcus hominis]MDS3915203.1 hypothetical protein [Staphylococcus hominis]